MSRSFPVLSASNPPPPPAERTSAAHLGQATTTTVARTTRSRRKATAARSAPVVPPPKRAAGDLERAVLTLLWSAGEPLMPFQVQQRLGAGLAQSTIATTLLRLVNKGMVQRTPRGRGFAYHPLRRAADHAAGQMLDFLLRGESPDSVLRCFAHRLSTDQRDVLLRALT
ncbi:BlaI/MecI/CopY family transcriptional regulator [Frankia tisae]|uniref:BlaI/MecI/CopY family transcriptional regulator n=1 Tax=Frankia tisae TaxID=2950104 RepID=UPI0021C0B8BA|nr:BlaI/MecI/CopY family transcriptional regulator [Frankia tisae]